MSSRSFDLLARKMVKERQYNTDKLRVENYELRQQFADLQTSEHQLVDLHTDEHTVVEASGKRFASNASPISPAYPIQKASHAISDILTDTFDALTDALTTATAKVASLKTVETQLHIENQTLREQVKEKQALQEALLKTQEQLRQALARIAELEKKKIRILPILGRIVLVLAGLAMLSLLIWQGVTSSGNPDPTLPHLSHNAVILDSGILVFRQGLEAILVLAAVTASFVGAQHSYRRPIAIGAGLALLATAATWFVAIGIIGVVKAPTQDIEAVTGLLAIILLLIIMNWFFHKIYWTGWISLHNRRRRNLVNKQKGDEQPHTKFGLALLGFTAVYREGFEIVLFLQNLRIQAGSLVVLEGIGIGLILTAIVGILTFVLHQKLPYKKMLIFTGLLLGVFLIVVVGQTAQNLQEAHWIPTTTLHLPIPDWMGVWFAVFPTVETLGAQLFAAILVIGSYFMAQYLKGGRPHRQAKTSASGSESAPGLQPSHATGSSTH
jgi:high-affinity iron transporter